MNTPRIPLKGETLAACNRILSQTPIESYTQIFSILLMRYEQDLIEATNGYLRPTRVPNKAPSQPDKVPSQPNKVPNEASNGDKQVPVQPKKTSRQLLMDFED